MILTPRVTKVQEQNTLDNRMQVVKSIVLTYFVGPHGPFKLVTNQADIQSGVANTAMQNFANTLNTLSGVAS